MKKILRSVSILMILTITAASFFVNAYADATFKQFQNSGRFNEPVVVSSGKSYTDTIIYSNHYGSLYYLKDANYVCYQYDASKSGTMTLDIKSSVNALNVAAFDAGNNVMFPVDYTSSSKSLTVSPVFPYSQVATTGSVKVSLKYSVKKGTNYFLLFGTNDFSYNDYTATTKFTFKADSTADSVKKPAKTTLIAQKTSGGFKLSWMAVQGITKYQIQYSEDGGKTFKTAGKVAKSKTTCTLKLDTGSSYVFRIRSYKTVNGKKYYSKWSNKVKV